jgi:hypothetical protein
MGWGIIVYRLDVELAASTASKAHCVGCRVAVLDGGLPAWKATGGEVETSPIDPADMDAPATAAQAAAPRGDSAEGGEQRNPPTQQQHQANGGVGGYKAKLRDEEVRSLDAVLANVASMKEQVVDARPHARWVGVCVCVGGWVEGRKEGRKGGWHTTGMNDPSPEARQHPRCRSVCAWMCGAVGALAGLCAHNQPISNKHAGGAGWRQSHGLG